MIRGKSSAFIEHFSSKRESLRGTLLCRILNDYISNISMPCIYTAHCIDSTIGLKLFFRFLFISAAIDGARTYRYMRVFVFKHHRRIDFMSSNNLQS